MNRVLFLLAVGSPLFAAASFGQFQDPRSLEVLRLDCVTGNVRSDLTLFGNGTLRVWEGELGSEQMELSELDPDSVEAYVRRLRQETLSDGLAPPQSVEGLWIERCRLTLDVPEGPAGTVSFGGLDSLSLALSRVVRIARELVALARSKIQLAGLSAQYRPKVGDVLLHRNGFRYRVNSFTSDGTGVELLGFEQPMALYVAIKDLPQLFLAVEDPPW
ncbi:MAG: hypothetical protein O7A98_03650 [Acidobacteria bacterium]|nr:hypothetical protein [Acidobacteriota bacterium]